MSGGTASPCVGKPQRCAPTAVALTARRRIQPVLRRPTIGAVRESRQSNPRRMHAHAASASAPPAPPAPRDSRAWPTVARSTLCFVKNEACAPRPSPPPPPSPPPLPFLPPPPTLPPPSAPPSLLPPVSLPSKPPMLPPRRGSEPPAPAPSRTIFPLVLPDDDDGGGGMGSANDLVDRILLPGLCAAALVVTAVASLAALWYCCHRRGARRQCGGRPVPAVPECYTMNESSATIPTGAAVPAARLHAIPSAKVRRDVAVGVALGAPRLAGRLQGTVCPAVLPVSVIETDVRI